MLLDDEKDIIKKFYYNEYINIYEANNKEFKIISKKIKKLESTISKKLNEKEKKDFEKYLEYINQRQSIDAENQFRNGFKTAIKVIIEGLKK